MHPMTARCVSRRRRDRVLFRLRFTEPTSSSRRQSRDDRLDDITAPQLTIDGEIEKCSVAEAPVLIEEKANGPNLSGL